jgi:cytochrome c-type biogenesis protein CcsB
MPAPAELSDWLFTSAVGVYMLAALLSALEYVVARQPAMAGGPAPVRPAADRFGRLGVSVTVLGAVLHLGSVVLRGIATSRMPLGNMYEYLSAVGLVAVVAWLSVLRTHQVRKVAVFVLLPVALLLFLAGNLLYNEAAALQPALQSYWIAIHVSAAVMASGVFLVSGVTSALHVLAEHGSARPGKTRGTDRLPAPEFLDRLAYRSAVFGFITITFAVITGAIWAESAWGRYWGWDPKETAAFVTWVCYAAYLHARATAGWRGRRAAWINVVGLAVVLFNLFFVNLVVAGLHSYAN